jgi:hypothetical protein
MMQCARGHFYDEVRHEECPYCGNVQQGVGATIGLSPIQDVGKTMPVMSQAAPKPGPGGADIGKTVGVIKKQIGIDPPVAFVVAVEGVHRGEDFKLHAGRNFVGRSADSDVALASDDTVSREGHALISYDVKNNSFLIAPGQGRGITYLNDHEVANAEALAAYDTIEVGKSKLVFLPLCGEQFKWE